MKEHRSEGEWAANSPDISAIENIFGDQHEKVEMVYDKSPQKLEALKKIVMAARKKLTAEICKKFVLALPIKTTRQDLRN